MENGAYRVKNIVSDNSLFADPATFKLFSVIWNNCCYGEIAKALFPYCISCGNMRMEWIFRPISKAL